MIHELGHAIFEYNCPNRPHPMYEEQLVNNFAIAYWRHYGEAEKFERLSSIIKGLLGKFVVPAKDNESYMIYAKENWGTEEFYSFNNYGWFQFSCVEHSISKQITLEGALLNMGLTHVQSRKKQLLAYDVDCRMAYKVIKDATEILCDWGVILPREVNVILSDDPNCHMCQSKPIYL